MLIFLSVSSGVDEVANPLGSSVVGSPGAVARTSDSSADGVAGSPGDVADLLAWGFMWSLSCSVQQPLPPGFPALVWFL